MTKTFIIHVFLILFIRISFANNPGNCNCWVDRDSTWQVAQFDGSGGSGGPGVTPDYKNDDWSTNPIILPFSFCFYGSQVDTIFINNNGNITIGSPYSVVLDLLSVDKSMIAPFFTDIDTRNLLSGVVYYKLDSNALLIQWDHVGYYNMHADKTATFQLILTDGNSAFLKNQNNVGFCYKEMQFTTGDASQGTNGFGGSPAQVGIHRALGTKDIIIGFYDNNSTNYDGPSGNVDGIFSLENQSFEINLCSSNLNVAPLIYKHDNCDTIIVCLGDTFIYEASFISPEDSQITTVTFDPHGLSNVNLVSSPANTANVSIDFIAAVPGMQTIDITGTDNGNPVKSYTYTLHIDVQKCHPGISENEEQNNFIYPNPVSNELNLHLKNRLNIIEVYSITGSLYCRKTSDGDLKINTQNWSKGIYYFRISSTTENRIFKVIIQ